MGRITLSLLLFILCACQGKEEASSSSLTAQDSYADSVEAGMTGIGGALDDVSNESMVAESKNSFWSSILISDAIAGCSRVLTNDGFGNCSRDVNCDYGSYLWSGVAEINFSNGNSCNLTGAGDSYLRTVNFARTGRRGILQTTSNDRTAWTGETIGGGMKITQVDGIGNLELDVLGQHKILSRNGGHTVFDVSFSSELPLHMNKLSRNGRTISDGVMVIHHNRAKFTAQHTFQNVSYSTGCCYPTSGTLSSTFTGSLNGSGSVNFHGCGQFTISINEKDKSYSMANCE